MLWLLEQYGFNHGVIASQDFAGELSAKYDVIVLPAGTTRESMVNGLDPKRHDTEWSWAYGVGQAGWTKLQEWVKNGGTLVAIGSGVEAARELLDLPIEKSLPEAQRRRFQQAGGAGGGSQVEASEVDRTLKQAFTSPASLLATLQQRVVEPESLFYCPGSLLQNEFDPDHPVGYGMPRAWPVFFETDQAYRLKPGFGMRAEVVARYPQSGPILQSGWLLGEQFLRDQANVVSFRVGRGSVVVMGSQVDFRTQPRATFKLLFNAIFQGPAVELSAQQLSRLATSTSTNDAGQQ